MLSCGKILKLKNLCAIFFTELKFINLYNIFFFNFGFANKIVIITNLGTSNFAEKLFKDKTDKNFKANNSKQLSLLKMTHRSFSSFVTSTTFF